MKQLYKAGPELTKIKVCHIDLSNTMTLKVGQGQQNGYESVKLNGDMFDQISTVCLLNNFHEKANTLVFVTSRFTLGMH